jgi:hypothetical protein
VIEAESQAVLNTLKEKESQDAFKKNGRRAGNCIYAWEGTTSWMKVASRPKVSFCHTAAPVLKIMDGSL